MGRANVFALFTTLILSVLLIAPLHTLAVPSLTNRLPSPPFQLPSFPQQTSHTGRPWSKFRDRIIRLIWRIPKRQHDTVDSGKGFSLKDSPVPKQSASYGGDVVLRFDINTAEEAKALAEAATVLFLDVWEFTEEWVDVRLAKEVVSMINSQRFCTLSKRRRQI